jgi:hypothetical protein
MALRATATRPTHMDFLAATTMSRISETTMIGKTITATDITIRSAATAALPMRAALADMKAVVSVVAMAAEEASVVGMAAAEALVVAMAVVVVADTAVVVVADIVSRETVQLSRSNHA